MKNLNSFKAIGRAIEGERQRQIELLEFLLEHGAVSRREVLRQMGQGVAPALESLLKNGLIGLQCLEAGCAEEETGCNLLPPASEALFALSEAQEAALASFRADLDAGNPASHLLFGVTGSGKTAVYMELAKECLRRGRSMLLLAPEVALALKLRRDASLALPDVPLEEKRALSRFSTERMDDMSNCTYARTSEEVQRMYSTVGQMDNCEGLFASWATDPAALKAVLPEPLAMMAPVVTVYSVNVYDANFASPYREAALIIPVLCNGTPGLYPVSFMLEGADNAVFVGRDQLGMPKKNAD